MEVYLYSLLCLNGLRPSTESTVCFLSRDEGSGRIYEIRLFKLLGREGSPDLQSQWQRHLVSNG